MPIQWKTMWLAAALCGVVAACGSVLESGKPARQVYLLHTPKAPASSTQPLAPASLILSVRAVPGLDTDLVQVLGDDSRLNPVANAHWADNTPEVFTSITRRYLSDTRNFTAVHVGTLARPDEWLLELELQAFYGIQDAAGITAAVLLKMEGTLRCNGAQHVLRIEQQASANGDSLASLVAAHQRALDAALAELTSLIVQPCGAEAQG